ncbi:TLR4 interactor with leucine rich repeats-like [Wyeomyia smithii]|uniref:TLR4 interactor with leucine rich repeats-like n=1 Tax=Wyeomyia smithii TaxID=174621 RepID=UPI002467C50D|nr:TLR4 interactor with leucine rich repeats-like [Wyeomyia smithii]
MRLLLSLTGVVLICHQLTTALLVKQYNCDNYVLSWCQLHNVSIRSDKDLQSVVFPKVQQVGFLNGSIPIFSHLINLSLFNAGVLRVFARGTTVNRLTLPNTIEQLYFRDNDMFSVEIDPNVAYSMRYLRIHVNKLRDITNFKQLKNLVELNLCENLIEHVSFEIFAEMKQLKQLLLCGNRIKTIEATININLPNLYHLDLSSNYLFNQTSLEFWNFPRLGNLSLRDNLITNLNVQIIAQRFKVLKILDVEHNSLDCTTYRNMLELVRQRSIIYNVDKRMCSAPTVIRRFVTPFDDTTNDDGQLQIRQLKERIYQQVKIINNQRAEIDQLRNNLSALMEQFDLVVGPQARANDAF